MIRFAVIESWTPDQVVAWLNRLGNEKLRPYIFAFARGRVRGDHLQTMTATRIGDGFDIWDFDVVSAFITAKNELFDRGIGMP